MFLVPADDDEEARGEPIVYCRCYTGSAVGS